MILLLIRDETYGALHTYKTVVNHRLTPAGARWKGGIIEKSRLAKSKAMRFISPLLLPFLCGCTSYESRQLPAYLPACLLTRPTY